MEKQYIEINAFINDLKSDQQYIFNRNPLYVAIVSEMEKELRVWAASEEAEGVEKVIHCKDCRYFDPVENETKGFCKRKNYINLTTEKNGFCNYAEHPIPPYDDHEVSGLLDD